MKAMISLSIFVFGSLFGWLGSLMDHGNWLGGWSLFLSVVGAFFGIWAGFKIYKNFVE